MSEFYNTDHVQYYDTMNDTQEYSPLFKVRSMCNLFPTKLFDSYDDAIDYMNIMAEEYDYDVIQIYESTDSGWELL